MINQFVIRLVMLSAILVTGASTAQAQQVDCRFFKVTAEGLNVFSEPRGDASFIGALNKNDFVCVAGDQQVGDRAWAYIAYKLLSQNQRKSMEGWAIKGPLQPATQAELTALRDSPSQSVVPPPQPVAPTQTFTPTQPTPPAQAAMPSQQDVVRFSEPLMSGPFPVNGHSLEELTRGGPEFPPIEGLEESIWKKTCNNCHEWNRQSLCVQANIYAKDPKMAFRKQHPYGGAEKMAMMKWAEGGCQ